MKGAKIIITDLDKTLLHSDKTISDYTIEIFNQCRAKGIKIAFATARSENSCKYIIERFMPDAIISNGGALVKVGDNIVYKAIMNEEICNKLLLRCINNSEIECITAETDFGYYLDKQVDEQDPNWIEYMPAYYKDFSNGMGCDAYKITIAIDDANFAKDIISDIPEIEMIPFSGENWFRYAHVSANKWMGINALTTYYGISTDKVVAFGDDYNDMEMIKNCGIGVAVANALDEVKALANDTCDSNDNDGLAKWLAKNVLDSTPPNS